MDLPVKILSVDDELDLEILLTQYFRRKIRKGEYEFYFAHNGIEALKVLLEHKDIDIILSDINMPEMDGLTLLTKVNELGNPALKCIMVSAYGDMGNIRTAMNSGAFDFATKPIDLDDLSRTIEKAIEQIDYIKSSQQEHTQLENLRSDLAVAGEIQHSILPQIFPAFPDVSDKVDIYASMTPTMDVGGDFYDFFRIDDDHIGIVMADVSGKGVPAAIFMAVSRTIIRATGIHGGSTDECMGYVNKLLCNESHDMMFVTVFYGIYRISTGELEYTNCGHNPPFVLKHNNKVERLPYAKNTIVGVIDGEEFQKDSMTLEPGDTIILYTDGVTEAENSEHGEFGESRLEETLKSVPGAGAQEIDEAIKEDLAAFVGDAKQSDDITMLILKRLK